MGQWDARFALQRSRLHAACSRWLCVFGCLVSCAQDYPLDVTLCDEWCNARHPVICDDEDPAGCVRDCEEQGWVPDPDDECHQRWLELKDCYAALDDDAFRCVSYLAQPKQPQCQNQEHSLRVCRTPGITACLDVCDQAGCPENEFCQQLCITAMHHCEEAPSEFVSCLWTGSEGCTAEGPTLELERQLVNECARQFPNEAACMPPYYRGE